MVAIVVAISVGLLAVGTACLLIVFGTVALAGLKVLNAAHESGTWLFDQVFRYRRSKGSHAVPR